MIGERGYPWGLEEDGGEEEEERPWKPQEGLRLVAIADGMGEFRHRPFLRGIDRLVLCYSCLVHNEKLRARVCFRVGAPRNCISVSAPS